MSDKRHFSAKELKNIGSRMKACRVLTGLNQEEFASKHSFPLYSIKSWEVARVIPRMVGLEKLIDACRIDGVFVKKNWLLFGEGTGPSFFLEPIDSCDSEPTTVGSFDLNYVETFKRECKKAKQNPIIATVEDDEMSPYFHKGDIVAGVLVNDDDLIPNCQTDILFPMLCMLSSGKYAPRWVHILQEGVFTRSNSSPHIRKLEPVSIGRIRWHLHV